MTDLKMNLQMFAAETNMTATTDLEPAISIDFANRLSTNITELQQLLGITDMTPMAAGSTIKIYKMEQVNTPDQVAEGETIPLTKIQQKLAKTIDLTLNKYRKTTSAEAIQRSGRALAINKTDEKLIRGIQHGVRDAFYGILATGTGTATGTDLQSALADAWDKVQIAFKDLSATPIFFVSSSDVASYLSGAQISTQTAFGMTYVKDFFGLGTLIISPSITKGKLYATAVENLNGAYVPANGGDVATAFNLSADETGLVGVTHSIGTSNATIETLIMSGVVFYPEYLDGVIVGTITPASGASTRSSTR